MRHSGLANFLPLHNVLLLLSLNTLHQAQGQQLDPCLASNFAAPVPRLGSGAQTIEIVYDATQSVKSDASEDCVFAFLSSYYATLKCTQLTDPANGTAADLDNGFLYIKLNSLSVPDPTIVPTEQLWEYEVVFNYEVFSQNCQQSFVRQYQNKQVVAREMANFKENSLSSTQCSELTYMVFSQIDQEYEFVGSLKHNVCDSLSCDGQHSSVGALEPLYLQCIRPLPVNCIRATCQPLCLPTVTGLDLPLPSYCDNGAQCSQDQDNPIELPTCDCSDITKWSVYYVGSTCGTVLYLWWFIVIFVVIFLLILLLCCFFCRCCPVYGCRARICPCCCSEEADDKFDEVEEQKQKNKQQAVQSQKHPIAPADTRQRLPTDLTESTNTHNKPVVRINSKPSEIKDKYRSRESTPKKSKKSSSSSSVSSDSLVRNLVKLNRGHSNAGYVGDLDTQQLTLSGNRLEIDQETYASSQEYRSNRMKRWVNPGQTMQARVKAKKTPYIEYDRQIDDEFYSISTTDDTYMAPTAFRDSPKPERVFNNTTQNYSEVVVETSREDPSQRRDRQEIDNPQDQNSIKLRPGMVPSVGPQFTVIEEGKVLDSDTRPYITAPVKVPKTNRYSQKYPEGRNSDSYTLRPQKPRRRSKSPDERDREPGRPSVNLSDLTEARVDPSLSGVHSRSSSYFHPGVGERSDHKLYSRYNPDESLGKTFVSTGDPTKTKRVPIDFSTVKLNFG